MPKGAFRSDKDREEVRRYGYGFVDNEGLKLTLTALADKYDKNIRDFISMCYNDPRLHKEYDRMRSSGETKVKSKAHHRQLISFPNEYVFDFVDTVMSSRHGPQWMQNKKLLNHKLIKPWLVVNKV